MPHGGEVEGLRLDVRPSLPLQPARDDEPGADSEPSGAVNNPFRTLDLLEEEESERQEEAQADTRKLVGKGSAEGYFCLQSVL